ncbi:BRO-N domain-containing protein [Chryseobacterium indologenes]|uniref:BRO-N domain-containing protein n=1 Tax=Chryseobacterium indologenes TaxID=253 RepID=UPI001BCC859F|nr:BRO family protein [Chryseobacterium indologenes]
MQLEIFNYQSDEEQMLNEIKTVEIDGEIWFAASDVAKTLGYKRPSEAVRQHCKERGTVKHRIPTKSGEQEVLLINEPNVYRLIIKSQLPSAEAFETWLFEEVVPSIRKKGFYGKIDRSQAPNFYIRYQGNFHKIDRNYFSVISELFVTLNAELEKVGYSIPDKGIDGKGMYPDISVGRLFSKYLQDTDSVHDGTHKTYPHSFPDGRPDVDARMYPIDALPTFRKFVYDVWIPERGPGYFKAKDPLALDYLPKLLN